MREDSDATVAWMRQALHDLSQPLTALECGLYLATMPPEGDEAASPEELMTAIQEALVQCERLMRQVRAMQDRVVEGGDS